MTREEHVISYLHYFSKVTLCKRCMLKSYLNISQPYEQSKQGVYITNPFIIRNESLAKTIFCVSEFILT